MEEGGRQQLGGRNLQQEDSPGHYFSSEAAAAAAAYPHPHHEQQQQQQQPSGPAAVGQQDSAIADPVQDWMRSRQAAFRDFERSFSPFQQQLQQQPQQPSVFDQNQLFYPPVSLSPYVNNNSSRRIRSDYGDSFDQGRGNANNTQGRGSDSFDQGRGNGYNNFDQQDSSTMLSSRGTQELSPKAKVSYDEGKFQVEFDVQDFHPEELSIKTEGDVLIVLAKRETKTESGGSFVSKQFEQRFTLPSGVKPEAITSALSKDGTLTVTAPRETLQLKQEIGGFKKARGSITAEAPASGHNNSVYDQSNQGSDEGLPQPRVKYDDDKFQISLDCQHYKPEELDVKVEGNSIIITAKQEIKESGGTRTRVFEQKFSLPSGVKAERVASTFGKDGVLTITAPRGNATVPQTIEQRMDRVLSPSNWEEDFNKRRDSSFSSSVASSRRDDNLRHDSSTFPSSHHQPSSSLAHQLGGSPVSSNNNNSSLFPTSSSDGISKIQYDDDFYKILINVADFKPEELIIKTVGNTVQFEAKHEEKTSDGHSFTSRNISQSFTLPRGVDPEAVSSSMSKEGVLTISAPLPPALRAQQNPERMVPIKQH